MCNAKSSHFYFFLNGLCKQTEKSQNLNIDAFSFVCYVAVRTINFFIFFLICTSTVNT